MLVPLHYYLLLLLYMHFSGNNCKRWLQQAQPPGFGKAQRQKSRNYRGTTKQSQYIFRKIFFMKKYKLILTLFWACQQPAALTYPETKKKPVVDTYFDTEVVDNYRWLEDDLSEETAQWVETQNKLTFGELEKIPFRAALQSRLEKLWNYEKIGAPYKEGEYTYFSKNEGLQNQYVIYRYKKDKAAAEVFLDPNTFSADGTTSLAGLSFSKSSENTILPFMLSEEAVAQGDCDECRNQKHHRRHPY